MNPFSFSGMGAVSFGTDRIQQLADDIFSLNGSRVPVVLISDAGVDRAGILDQTGMSRSLTEKAIDPDTLAELMMSPENLPMAENNARPISKGDALSLARRTLGAMGSES